MGHRTPDPGDKEAPRPVDGVPALGGVEPGQRPRNLPQNPPETAEVSELHEHRCEDGTPAITWLTC